ncbi:hypothetical protein BLSMQ_3365 [Brevibacterium aurantiacum]|uniref:Uncharacterized protein n=1 Tax=Brevibacterium aurantiacum TaxID=273384 RepID=A0A1D7W7X5_BREAU|nr:hypothetical protein BLSMQ_3365 [Brevibacterium aurantiacum]
MYVLMTSSLAGRCRWHEALSIQGQTVPGYIGRSDGQSGDD